MTRRLQQHRHGRDRGAVLLFVAILLPILLTMTAFAIDLGRQRASRRTMQARADIIALDMVRLADGRDEATILSSPGYSSFLIASANANHAGDLLDRGDLIVEYGTWTQGGGFIGTLATGIPNAVKVTASNEVDYFFRPGTGNTTRSAVARTDAKAGFSIGSFAANLNTGNSPLFNQLLGNALNTSVLSYDGLVNSDLTWLGIANQMGLGTPTELFTGDVSAYDVVEASAEILAQQGADAATLAIYDQVLAVPDSPLHDVNVGDVVRVDSGGEDAALESGVNVLDFLATAAFIANGESGVSIPATFLNLPGSNLTGSINLIQQPQTVFGPVGASTGTSQAGASVQFTLGSGTTCQSSLNLLNLLGGLVNNLTQLLLGGPACQVINKLITVEITADVTLNLATAQGTIARIGCGAPQELDIDIRSDLVSATVDLNAVVKSGATVLTEFPLSAGAGGGDFNGASDFVLPPDQFDTFYPVNPGSGALGLSPATFTLPSALAPLVSPVLNTLLNGSSTTPGIVPLIEEELLTPLADIMGVRVASANVAPRAVSCHTAQLVG